MPTSRTIPINPDLLRWARQESGYELVRVAKRLNVKAEKVEAWEAGQKQPTIRQVENLARFLHRPLSTFFLQQRPQLTPLAAEYRRLPNVVPGHESPELRLGLRQMLARRENTLNLMGELGEPIPDFRLVASLRESPVGVGARLRHAANISVEEQLLWPSEWRAWAMWRTAIENLGVLVFQFSKVSLSEVRGVALLRTPLPVVGINSKENPEGRCFTALHETVHLMLAAGHEEGPAIQDEHTGEQWDDIERFAEVAASHALVPEAVLVRQIESFQVGVWDTTSIRRLARRFRITPLAMATRLRESGYLSWAAYRVWRREWDQYIASLPKRSGGFATPVSKALGRNGRPFTQLVLEALSANRLSPVSAARYLDLKFEHFEKLKAAVYQGPAAMARDD